MESQVIAKPMPMQRLIAASQLSPTLSVLLVAYLLAGWWFLFSYLATQANAYTGLLLAPYLLIVRSKGNTSSKYLWPALVCLGLSFFSPLTTFYYLAFLFAVLFLIESQLGKVNYLLLLLFAVLSPAFTFVATVFGFPIRLQLSEWAGQLVQLAGIETIVSGNIIYVKGAEFAVDPACVGLTMLTASFIITLFILAWQERRTGKILSFPLTVLVMAITVGLNILCNLIRIVLLIILRIMPDNPMHDVVGILCLMVYVLLPILFIIRLLYRYQSTQEAKTDAWVPAPGWRVIPSVLLLLLLVYRGYGGVDTSRDQQKSELLPVEGFKGTALNKGILKYEKANVLVYVKPVEGFHGPEHNPMICWTGSGYTFKKISQQTAQGMDFYQGVLQKGQERIYTAWWFDNGHHRTIQQSDWRWRMLKGEPAFSLINVNCTTEEQLLEEVNQVMKLRMVKR